MDLIALIVMTLAVTPSGAMSPGPLTVSAIASGVGRGWRGGVLVSLGHMIFELPYVVLLSFALTTIKSLLKGILGYVFILIASGFIVFFAYLLIKDALRISNEDTNVSSRGRKVISANPVITGFVLTAFNVYFLLWWVSVGFPLIVGATSLGIIGFVAMYSAHVWMDFAWLGIISELGGRGASLMGRKYYKIFLLTLAAVLLLFAINLITTKFLGVHILPF